MGVEGIEWTRPSKACAGGELSQIACAMAYRATPHAVAHVCSGIAPKPDRALHSRGGLPGAQSRRVWTKSKSTQSSKTEAVGLDRAR